MFRLYSYYRSSASYRVRCALQWKGLSYETIPIHLIKGGGEQRRDDYLRINPMGHVPALDHDGFLVAESVAIVDYLDRVRPERPLFPESARERARVLQICEILNSGIQPLQNLKVTQTLEADFGLPKTEVERWVRTWIQHGFTALERVLAESAGTHCLGGEVTAADCFLVPQCFAARRFQVKVENYPTIARVEAAAITLPEFQRAHPEKQPDYSP